MVTVRMPHTSSTNQYRTTGQYREFSCGIHSLTYKATSAGCPLCEAERTIDHLRQDGLSTRNRIKLLEDELHSLKLQVDLVYAMREASATLGDEDREFLKAILYQWRNQKSVTMKTTHGTRGGKRAAGANGFLVMPRKGDPWGYACSSMGGLAMAEYFEEALNTVGPLNAMTILTRSMAAHLPGGLPDPWGEDNEG